MSCEYCKEIYKKQLVNGTFKLENGKEDTIHHINICVAAGTMPRLEINLYNGENPSFSHGILRKINYCPMCGRKLKKTTNIPE